MAQSLNTSSAEIYIEDSPIDCILALMENDMMDENEKKPLSAFLAEAEVKIVWREEEKTKVG